MSFVRRNWQALLMLTLIPVFVVADASSWLWAVMACTGWGSLICADEASHFHREAERLRTRRF